MENTILAKKLNKIAIVVSIVVLAIVGVMRGPFKLETGIDFSFLPPITASINVLVAIALLAALYFVKQKNIEAHKKAIYLAFALSFLFLLSYVTYHFTTPETLFGDLNHDRLVTPEEKMIAGSSRTIYFTILFSHIVLAAISFPLILFTFIRGYTGQVEKHRKMARWVYPMWLYVAITGPLTYYLLMPYY